MMRQLIFTVLILAAEGAMALEGDFSSTVERVDTVELYTSEGCSSCPPADRWLSGLQRQPGLWQKFIPLAFHVDYWDRLGWPDRFASRLHSTRQRQYHHSGLVDAVYTPAVVVNGHAWRGWQHRRSLPEQPRQRVGQLHAALKNNQLTASFRPSDTVNSSIELHAALLGFEMNSTVKRGENAGRQLRHDFVVLTHHQIARATDHAGELRWQGAAPPLPKTAASATRLAMVFWLQSPGIPMPLQATGGWLERREP